MVKLVKKTLGIALAVVCAYQVCAGAPKKQELVPGEGAHYEVTVKTSEGTIKLKLHNDTPKHRDNFVELANKGFYNNLLFHRVIRDFMIQAGDPDTKEASQVKIYGKNDAGYKLDAEVLPHYYHKKGALAAARQGDDLNPDRKSSGSQFYIVVGRVHNDSTLQVARERIAKYGEEQAKMHEITPERESFYRNEGGTPHLDGGYTIFGEVVSGMKVVEKISKVPTNTKDRPRKDVYIKSMTVELVADK